MLWFEPSETQLLLEQEMAECTHTQVLFYRKMGKFVDLIGRALMVALRDVMGVIAHFSTNLQCAGINFDNDVCRCCIFMYLYLRVR